MLYVGDGADVGNSVIAAKNVPASAGELVSPNSSPFNTYSVNPTRAIYVPPITNQNSYQAPQRIYVPQNSQGTTPASTFRLYQNLGPQYFPSSTPAPVNYFSPTNPAPYTSSTPQPIYPSSTPTHYYSTSTANYYPSSTASPNYYPSSTPAPSYYQSSTPSPIHYFPSSTPVVDIHPNADPKYHTPILVSSTVAPPTQSTSRPIAVYSQTPRPIAVNYVSPPPQRETAGPVYPNSYTATTPSSVSVIGYTASTPSPIERPAPIAGKYASPVNNYITETQKNKYFYEHERNRGYYNKRFVDYKPHDQEYDGISTVQNGFR